ncbi:MAG: hypothetical protein COB69_09970 [Phycisphaera sp.]|nr:MAG: hypothetical protein COB69_09970 [Phycisphaera sp.]
MFVAKLQEIKDAEAQALADFDPSQIDRSPVIEIDEFSGRGSVAARVWFDTADYLTAATHHLSVRARLRGNLQPSYRMDIEFRYDGSYIHPIRHAVIVWSDPVAGDGRFTVIDSASSYSQEVEPVTELVGELSLSEITIMSSAQSVQIAFYSAADTGPIFGPFELSQEDKDAVAVFIKAVNDNSQATE